LLLLLLAEPPVALLLMLLKMSSQLFLKMLAHRRLQLSKRYVHLTQVLA
jgi:hypothetical protein